MKTGSEEESKEKPTNDIADRKESTERMKKHDAHMKEYLITKYFSEDIEPLEDGKDAEASSTNRLLFLQDHKNFIELVREKPSASSEEGDIATRTRSKTSKSKEKGK